MATTQRQMKLPKILNGTLALMCCALALVAVTGCGQKTDTEKGGAETVIVATGTSYRPYCYLDENGKLAGYEYEVLKAVDELLPQYEFKFKTSTFGNMLVELSAGQIDLAAHQFETNPEREQKYLFGKESYTTFITYPVVLANREDLKTLEDLQGKVGMLAAGDNSKFYLDEFNEAHKENPIKLLLLNDPTEEVITTGLREGKWDATFRTKRDVTSLNQEYGRGETFLKILEKPLQTSSTYWLYTKGNTKLQKAVDSALVKLKASGRLAQISIQILGDDFTTKE